MSSQSLATSNPGPLAVLVSDRRLMSQFNSRRADDSLRLAVEVEHLKALAVNNPAILECEPDSIKHTLLQGAGIGLTLNPALGFAYAIPYKRHLTFSVGYRGMEHMCLSARTIKAIQANLVLEGDHFEVWTDEKGTHLAHHPKRGGLSTRKVVNAYVVAQFANGAHHVEIMDAIELANVEKAASARNAAGGAVWRSVWSGEMKKKAVVRRAWKHWPKDPEGKLARVMTAMDEAEPINFADVPPPAPTPQGEAELLVSEDEVRTLESLLSEYEYPKEKHAQRLTMITDYFGVESLQNLPAKHYDEAKARLVAWLETWKNKVKK